MLAAGSNRIKRSAAQTLGDAIDAGLGALLVGGAAALAAGARRRSGNADRADEVLAGADRQPTRRRRDLLEMQRAGAAGEARRRALAVFTRRRAIGKRRI